VAGVRDYLQEQQEVVYQAQQSYYELLHAAGLSYHKSEKVNPQRDGTPVQERREAIKKVAQYWQVAQHWKEIEQGGMVVLLEDECHLLWGDVCGYAWGCAASPLKCP
jgi:Winged helix-turn helix